MLQKLSVITVILFSMNLISACASGPRPFDSQANAEQAIANALDKASDQKKVLLTFGANWCSDSRELAGYYQQQPLAKLLSDSYEIVFIDVGERDNNMALAEKYQVPVMGGIPAIAVLKATGETEFVSAASDLSNAEKMTAEEIHTYFADLK